MPKKNETVATRQRNKAASVRGAGPAATKPASLRAGATEVTRKAPAKRANGKSKPAQELTYTLVPMNPPIGWAPPDPPMTKAEILSMLAEEVLREPIGPDKTKIGGFKIPAKLAAAADLLYETRRRRLDLNKHVEAMKVQEAALKDHLIDNLPKSDSTGVAGKVARAQVHTEDSPAAEDWETFYKHLKKTGQFDLMNKAINRKAIKERWAAGKEVPGIGHFEQVKISLTKVGG